MTDHDPDQDDVLQELDAALQVEPSRAFADGVRARVNRSRTNTTRVWWGLAAAASLGLAAMTLWRPSTYAPANDAPAKVAVAPAPATAPAVPSKAPESVVAVEKAVPPVTRREATIARATVATIADEPRLEVITNQGAVLRQLWASYGARALQETTVEMERPAPSTEMKAPALIAVEPIVVPPIVVSELGSVGGRGGATPVIRRVDAAKETK